MIEALCWHEAFRRLGYSADDIFVATAGHRFDAESKYNGPAMIVQVIKCDKTFTIIVPDPDKQVGRDEVFSSLWAKAVEWWCNASDKEIRRYWNNSRPREKAALLVKGLNEKGMYPINDLN